MLAELRLPDYTPSILPGYSSTPLPGEQCIQRTPRQADHYRENCAFTYEEHGMSLTLRGCREEKGIPTFGLCSNVYGEFAPKGREKIVSVVVKAQLEAQIRVQARLGILFHTLFSKERPLWRRSDSANDVCPSILPISLSFPSTYREKSRDRPYRLPPSMAISDPCPAAIVYSLNVIVRKATIFSRTREVCLSAYLRYSPRVRPPRPSPVVFSSLKIYPEEWQEEIWAMTKAPACEDKNPLVAQCHLFVPSVRVFAWSETIPFHVSFCSSTGFLSSIAAHMTQLDISLEKPIHVFLLRRTSISVGNCKCIHEEVLGTGRIVSNSTTAVESVLENTETLSWDGEIQCEQSIEYSSFTTTVVEVRDFLVLSLLAPPGPLADIPQKLYQAFPIRLVTHPWVDRS